MFFWGVDSKSTIHFFSAGTGNPRQSGKYNLFRIIEVFRCRTKKMDFSICSGMSENPLLMPREFGKLPLIRRSTVANPEYHQLYFMPFHQVRLGLVEVRISWVRLHLVAFG